MKLCSVALALGAAAFVASGAPAKRPLTIDDFYRIQDVRDPHCSPDGSWIVYTVTSVDRAADKLRSDLWMVSWDGAQDLRLSRGPESDSSPRWSPDGRHLAFVSSPPNERNAQIWVLDRRGGQPRQLTHVKDEIVDYAWSPDGKRMVLVLQRKDDGQENDDSGPGSGSSSGAAPKPPKPIVIDRYRFKHDAEGYVTSAWRKQLYLFEVETGKLEKLTNEKNFDESEAAWSPDGTRIAFVANREKDADETGSNNIFVIDPHPGATPRKLVTTYQPDHQQLVWSPDGQQIAYLQGFEPRYNAYNQDMLMMVPAAGGPSRALAPKFDRNVLSPEFSSDGSSILFLTADDRSQYLARVAVSGGSVERLMRGSLVASEHCRSGGHTAVIASTDSSAPEIFALEDGRLRKLTSHNDALLSELQLGAVEDIRFQSGDSTEIHGMMVKPPGYEAGKKYPTLLWIHGGPNMQDDHSVWFGSSPMQLERQLFAAHGYVVLAINYRGSSGRGAEFIRSIFRDWGNKEVADLLAAVEHTVRRGIADPERLGVGGWSYGGILTEFMIAKESRFKAAVSSSGSANQLSMYGSDQYILQYNNEFEPPWINTELWMKLSYPFFHAERIHTPTLFMGGDKDFDVPVIGSEQMYQALRTLGVPTQLVIYPGEYHVFTRPSFVRDRLERALAWFDKYLMPQR